jgi:tRNA(adenine34) deaminase
MILDHEHFMGVALDLARTAAAEGNRPVGSLIVDGAGNIAAQGGNRVYTDSDPTAHGELLVIREAGRQLKGADFTGYTLYSSLEPCPMCCWAIIQSNVSRLVLGARHAALNNQDLGRYTVETLLELTGRSIELVTGVRERECEDLRRAWNAERAKRGLGPR